MKTLFLTSALLTTFAVAAFLLWSATRTHPPSEVRLPIADYLPTGEAEGWTYEDLPLGHTESLDAKAHEILGLTDFVYRRYTRGSESFEVYIAYWAPGTMPARMMNQHTPDTCWRAAGWHITQRDDAFLFGEGKSVGGGQSEEGSNQESANRLAPTASQSSAHHPPPSDFPTFVSQCLTDLPIPDLGALPGRWRVFEKSGAELPVVFWHLLEGKVYEYGHQSILNRLERLVLDPLQNGFDTRKEQWLVRVSL